jgi:hypothetical protein
MRVFRRSSGLHGPRLTYGGRSGAPVRERRRIAPGPVVLAVGAAVLAVLLVVSLHRGIGNLRSLDSASPGATSTVASSGSDVSPDGAQGSDASEAPRVPAGANEAAARFVEAWLDPHPQSRQPALEPVTAPGLAEQLANVDPAKIPKAQAVGSPTPGSVSAYSATFKQRLSNKTTIVVDLAADPEARYGWLVYMVSPGEGR